MSSGSRLATSSNSRKRFAIALSFPGERRAFVEGVARCLAETVGTERVLFDSWYEAEFARPGLDVYLPRLYREESELVALFIEENYERKQWCRLEWRSIHQIITDRPASIMPCRFDTTEIPGLLPGDGYVRIGERSPEDIAALILMRWRGMSSNGEPELIVPSSSPTVATREAAEPADGDPPGTVLVDGVRYWPLLQLWIHVMALHDREYYAHLGADELPRQMHQRIEEGIRSGRVPLYVEERGRARPVRERRLWREMKFAANSLGHVRATNRQVNGIGVLDLYVLESDVRRFLKG